MTNKIKTSQVKEDLLKKLRGAPGEHKSFKTQSNLISLLEPAKQQKEYSASFAQNRIFILHEMSGESLSYNLPTATIIEGKIDLKLFKEAANKLILHHEALRTGIEVNSNGDLVQKIHDIGDFCIETEVGNEKDLPFIMKRFKRKFDLQKPPLMRILLVRFNEQKHVVLFDIHHIIADGISLTLLIHDFFTLYTRAQLPQLKFQYKDYAIWQNKWFESDEAQVQLKFWKKMFEDEVPVLNLPTDFSRPALQSFTGNKFVFEFDKELTTSIKALGKDSGGTLFITLLAIYKCFLAKYTGQEDIVVGSPVAGRSHPELQKVVGMFVNTIAVRSYPQKSKLFFNYLIELKNLYLNVFENQEFPFEKLVEALNLSRDTSRNPLFDTMFALQNMPRQEVVLESLRFRPCEYEHQIANFDLELYAFEEEGKIRFKVEYSTQLFKHSTISRMMNHFKQLAQDVVNFPNKPIGELSIVNPIESQEIIKRYQGPGHLLKDNLIQRIFEEQVEKFPDRIAVSCESRSLTYLELNQKSNQVAYALKELGAGREKLVCIILDREIEFLMSMLGTFKSGAAYVPIDPSIPEDRIKTILEESGAKIILTENKYKHVIDSFNSPAKVICIEDLLLQNLPTTNPEVLTTARNLAYVIFTSGSTGKPKGAMLEHTGMMNHLKAKALDLSLNETDVVAQTATQSFDVSVWQFLVAILVGGRVVVFKGDSAWDPIKLMGIIAKEKVTVFETVPSHLLAILDELELNRNHEDLSSLRWMIVNGEALLADVCRRWFKLWPSIQMLNAYGPTECSDDVTHRAIFSSPPADYSGMPIDGTIINHSMYILDAALIPVPQGVIGELYIGGIGIGRGYLSDPEKTADAFLPDLFSDKPGTRMYRTRDLVRHMDDGRIDFLGRADGQVKIRGFRIELSEIEHKILRSGFVKATVVLVHKDQNNNQFICAYIIFLEGTVEQLKYYLEKVLPGYMVPTQFIVLEHFPLLHNGKINRKALPSPNLAPNNVAETFVAPRNQSEQDLVKIFSEVLGIDSKQLGVFHNFFELGGNSLKAMQLVTKINAKFGVRIPFTTLFKTSTVSELLQKILEENRFVAIPLESYPDQESYIPTFEQKRIFEASIIYKDSLAFNMPYEVMIKGSLDPVRVRFCFEKLMERHEALRMSFKRQNDRSLLLCRQHDASFDFSFLEIAEESLDSYRASFLRPFNLNLAPPFRAQLLKLGPQKYALLFDNHAIAADAVSKQNLLREFLALYGGFDLLPLKLKYSDYMIWKNKMSQSESVLSYQKFWETVFPQPISKPTYPTDLSCLSYANDEGARIPFEMGKDWIDTMTAAAGKYGINLPTLCFAAFSSVLSSVFEHEEIVVFSPVSERGHSDLDPLVGLFFNTVPIKSPRKNGNDFVQYLKEFSQVLYDSYAHQEYPATELYEKLSTTQINEHGFDTTFVWVEFPEEQHVEGLEISTLKPKHTLTRFDLRLEAHKHKNRLQLIFDYRKRMFAESTIRKLMEYMYEILEKIAK